MFNYNELSKGQKAGLIIGGIECIVGFGVAIYAHVQCKKMLKELEQESDNVTDTTNYVDELLNNDEE